MNGVEIFTLVSALTALAGVLLTYVTNRRAGKSNERKVNIDERLAEESLEDGIAERRLGEINRLSGLVDTLRHDMDEMKEQIKQLQASDKAKSKVIQRQANQIVHSNDMLRGLRDLFLRFVSRVDAAWSEGDAKPMLTERERLFIEQAIPDIYNWEHPPSGEIG